MAQFILHNLWMIPLALAARSVPGLEGLGSLKAARVGSVHWFVALLLVNTLGILEILYIYVFSKASKQQS